MRDPIVEDRYFSMPPNLPDFLDERTDEVDLDRYAGKWYEVAAFPAWFEKGCLCSTATFIHMDNYVEVAVSCLLGGFESTATAEAYPIEGSRNFKFNVRFLWPYTSDYWIVALDKEYQYAAVGHVGKQYLWILSRQPAIEEAVYRSLLDKALVKGYDISKLRKVEQYCGWQPGRSRRGRSTVRRKAS
jgi:apolipoprotein D and lipocalin family protein